ncbi:MULTISPECIES: hypothetical protein [Streptosporangium]|uniref:Ricin B lectin domain-containing protein n=1 Tax=Streptosporangium brasiliense TaxID=47480 RepID=A0ABT9RBD8_9ACTN|nr:hypothetical protein [Streptosporangium brasiliense]MDP9866583.1 hypothetical protein [Streptosporangium brasiliense]
MRGALRFSLGLTTAAVVALGLPSAATASTAVTTPGVSAAAGVSAAGTRHWGPTASSDTKGWAGGAVRSTGSGLRISGDLYDGGGARTCSWLKIKWLTDRGRHRTATFKNCSQSRTLAFRVNAGYMLSAQAKVCRGTSTRVTGRCSGWEGVWSQGG